MKCMQMHEIRDAMRALREQVNPIVSPELRPKDEVHVHVFDNGGETVDRYTVYIRTDPRDRFAVYTMSEDAFSPQGVNMYSHTVDAPMDDERDMAQTVPFAKIPFEVALAIVERATYI